MRYKADENGNGAKCDKCKNKVMRPNVVIKIKSFRKEVSDSTGVYNQLAKADLCEDCYKELMKWLKLS